MEKAEEKGPAEQPTQWRLRRGIVALIGPVLAGCGGGGVQSMLDPAGTRASEAAELWWLMFFMGLVVYLVVVGLLLAAVFRRWRATEANEAPREGAAPPLGHTPFVLLGGAVLPAGILVTLLVFALDTQVAMNRPEADLTVQVVGHQWWWEVRYPEYGITTANEIHIPTGEPVQLVLSSADVIHSFWVPRLGGKRDLLPEKETTFWLEADAPDVFRGQCAEYCGLQHTHMALQVVAVAPKTFDEWVLARQAPPTRPADTLAERGRRIFTEASCAECHRIEGTLATSNIGPDLTHIASRRTLGAGMIENNRGNLYGWIANPQRIKPGNRMPPTVMAPEDLHALVAYLESLE